MTEFSAMAPFVAFSVSILTLVFSLVSSRQKSREGLRRDREIQLRLDEVYVSRLLSRIAIVEEDAERCEGRVRAMTLIIDDQARLIKELTSLVAKKNPDSALPNPDVK